MEKIEKLEKELAELKKELKTQDDYVLKLKVEESGLCVVININETVCDIGRISPSGRCYMINTDDKIRLYEKWRDYGMKVDDSVVEWRGGKYQLMYCVLQRIDIDSGCIYSFKYCLPQSGCADENIKRHKHNNMPILY